MLEAAVGLTLLAGAMLLIVATISRHALAVRDLRQLQIAANLAEAEVERLRAMPYAQLQDRARSPLELTSPAAKCLRNSRASLTIREHDPERLGLKHVTVIIRWNATVRREAAYRIETFIAQRGGDGT